MLGRKLGAVLLSKLRLETLHAPHVESPSFKSASDTFKSLLRRCRDSKSLSHGQIIHNMIVSHGFDLHSFFQNLLIQMYGSCGALPEASTVLVNIPLRNAFSWTFMIRAYAEHGYSYKALEAFEQMKLEGMALPPCKYLYINILSSCNCAEISFTCNKLHVLILSSEIDLDHVLGAALVHAYKRCKTLEDAEKTFSYLPKKDVFLYNIMIGMHAETERRMQAIQLFHRMHLEGLMFDNITIVSTLVACASMEMYLEGKRIHARLSSLCGMDTRVCNAVVSMYSKAGSLPDALKMFNMMHQREVIAWNAMIVCFVINKEFLQAFFFFEKMHHDGKRPSKVTFLVILSACANTDELTNGKVLHAYIVDVGFDSDTAIGNALIAMYGRSGTLKDAHKVFNDLPQRDGTSWMSVATAYIRNGECMGAHELITNRCIDSFLYHTTSALASTGRLLYADEKGMSGVSTHVFSFEGQNLGSAQQTYDVMPIWNVTMWSIIMAAHVRSGNENVALELFSQMQQNNVNPDNYICATVLSACASLRDLKVGRHLHAWIMCNSEFAVDSALSSALVHLYGKCGGMEDAQFMFTFMAQRNTVAWTALIEAYVGNAMAESALQHHQQMLLEGVLPDIITLVAVSTACFGYCSLGQGKQLHACIEASVTRSDLLTGNALISMYAKCGSLRAAQKVFDNMSERGPSTWNAIITGCAQSGHLRSALSLFHRMQQNMILPNMVTMTSILAACSHGGLSCNPSGGVSSLCPTSNVMPTVEHFNSLIGTLGKSGRLDLADYLIKIMPFHPNAVTWMAYLGACKNELHLEQATRAANIVHELDPTNLAPFVLLANTYAACGQVEKSSLLRNIVKGPSRVGTPLTFKPTSQGVVQV